MTDRFNALTVVLERDILDDDAEGLILAISRLRGVHSVVPHVADIESHIAEERAMRQIRERIWKALES